MANRLASFFSEVGDEMKKVSWPNKEQLQESTMVTILVVILFTLFTFVVDLLFRTLIQDFIFSLA